MLTLIIILLLIFVLLYIYNAFSNEYMSIVDEYAIKNEKFDDNIIVLIYNDPKKKAINENERMILEFIFSNDRYYRLFNKHLFKNVKFIYVTDQTVPNILCSMYDRGVKYFIGLGGTQEMLIASNFFLQHPDTRLFNFYSTALIDKPKNIFRLQVNDSFIVRYACNKIKNSVCVFDANHEWAISIAKLLQQVYNIIVIPYSNGSLQGIDKYGNYPITIAAVAEKQNIINSVPYTCPKLFGFDGSIFFNFTDENVSNKAISMKFECIQGEPSFIPSIIYDIKRESGLSPTAGIPLIMDGIQYAKGLQMGLSDDEIQKLYVSFTGTLEFDNGDRSYSNLEWYQYSANKKWLPTEKIITSRDGSCNIFF